MTVDRWLRAIAGAFITLSVILAVTVHINWLYFTAFVGLNLFQSAFTRWCPMITILRKLGVPEQAAPSHSR
jgi:hypothetical protein